MLRPRDDHAGDVWSAERLRRWIRTFYGGESIVVLANREPVRHDRAADDRILATRSASGLVTALEPLTHACSGVWVARGAGTADRAVVDRRDGLDVPPGTPFYRLRRVWLEPHEERGYYYGFANEGLWPLCHRAHVQPVFRFDDFQMYRLVNARFADAVSQEVQTDSPPVLVQAYHFALAPHIIRKRLPLSTIVAFWHIPWPHASDYATCPWRRELLEGLLGSSIVGFQTPDDCRNFVDAGESSLDGHINRSRNVITYAGHRTKVRAYPVSVEWPSRWASQWPSTLACRESIRRQLQLKPNVRLGVGIDRLDHTKGINEKFLAVERLLESHPDLRGRFAFVQIAEPSRHCLPAYRELQSRLVETSDRINLRFGAEGYRPIILLEAHHEPVEVFRFLRAADLCYVGGLHDGMNLVGKEFVGARDDDRGVLILSKFAGAAHELTGALMVNPYAIDEASQALFEALGMTSAEQSKRMRAMRQVVAEFNAYRWAGEMLTDATRLRTASTRRRQAHEPRWPSHVLQAVS
jgi:trehalose 6-phosphate synthase